MDFEPWMPGLVFTFKYDADNDLLPVGYSYGQLVDDELMASMVANAAIFKMMRGESK